MTVSNPDIKINSKMLNTNLLFPVISNPITNKNTPKKINPIATQNTSAAISANFPSQQDF